MSTTIHITTIDERMTLAIVATLLNQPGVTISIDLDEMNFIEPNYMDPSEGGPITGPGSRTLRAKRDPLRRPIIDARGEQSPPITAYGAKVGFDGNDYYIDGRVVTAAEFDREMTMRARARDERRAETVAARGEVECTSCGAEVGELCRSASGKAYTDFVHIDRIRALHTVNQPVPVRDSATRTQA